MDKSLFPRDPKGFGYGYGVGFRGTNTTNLDRGILKVSENFETGDKREVLGSLFIHVGDLLISGGSEFAEYISWEPKAKFEADSYGGGGDKETYSGMGIGEATDSDSEGII